MKTYTTLDKSSLDLSKLRGEERAYFDRCYAAYQAHMGWIEFSQLVTGEANPLVREADGRVTESVWRHPLYQALRDLEDRLGIRQGYVRPEPGDEPEREPLVGATIAVAKAAP